MSEVRQWTHVLAVCVCSAPLRVLLCMRMLLTIDGLSEGGLPLLEGERSVSELSGCCLAQVPPDGLALHQRAVHVEQDAAAALGREEGGRDGGRHVGAVQRVRHGLTHQCRRVGALVVQAGGLGLVSGVRVDRRGHGGSGGQHVGGGEGGQAHGSSRHGEWSGRKRRQHCIRHTSVQHKHAHGGEYHMLAKTVAGTRVDWHSDSLAQWQ